jgi:hypothetical protein
VQQQQRCGRTVAVREVADGAAGDRELGHGARA